MSTPGRSERVWLVSFMEFDLGYFDDEDWDKMMSRALLLFKMQDQPQLELWDDGKKMWLEPPRFP